MPDRSLYLPFPEFVDPRTGRYRIVDSRGRATLGSVDRLHRRLYVPLSADGQGVARHELAHVHHSPESFPEVDFPIVVLHCVEDARINLALEHLPLPVDLDAEQRAHVQLLGLRDLKSGRAADFALRWVASLGTNAEPDLAAIAAATGDESAAVAARLVARVHRRLEDARAFGVIAPFAAAVAVAEELARALAARAALDPHFGEITLKVECCVVEDACDAHELGRARGSAPDEVADDAGFGALTVVSAPLECDAAPGRGLRRSWRAAAEGSQLGALHRWAFDRTVFKRPVRRVGGSVLVDTSGSMHFGEGDLEAILDVSRGAALVAIYSGKGAEGQLRVVAREGRRAAPEYLQSFGRGNIVDGPALRWLAKQPGPRFWVSDGLVTGIGDKRTSDLASQCAEICRAARIRRFATPAEAARGLASGSRGRAS